MHHARTDQTLRAARPSAVVGLLAAQFLVVADASIVNVAIPSIERDLGLSLDELHWVLTAYVLVYGGVLLLGGRAGDVFGHTRVLTTGLAIFGAAALAGGMAPNGPLLMTARALQGLGAALLTPATVALITTTAGRRRGRLLAWWSAVNAAGFAAGVFLGAVIVQYGSWRAVLTVNAPAAFLVWLAIQRGRVGSPARAGAGAGRLDLPGALSITGALSLVIYAVAHGTSHGWTHPTTIVCLALFAILAVGVLLIEARTSAPMLPPSLFRTPSINAGLATVVGTGQGLVDT